MLGRLFSSTGGMLTGIEIAEAQQRQERYTRWLRDGGPIRRGMAAAMWGRSRRLSIDPFNPAMLNPNSYNLSLANELKVYRMSGMPYAEPKGSGAVSCLDMKRDNPVDCITIPPQGMVLRPEMLYLARTVEHTESYNLVPVLDGRSSIGRLGIFIHITAGFGDIGYCGCWTLELVVVHPVRVYPDVPICQIRYTPASHRHVPYASCKYQGAEGVQASRLYMELNDNGHTQKRDQPRNDNGDAPDGSKTGAGTLSHSSHDQREV